MKIGKYELAEEQKIHYNVEGETVEGTTSTGTLHIYSLIGPRDIGVEVAYVIWDNAEREGRQISAYGEKALDGLNNRLRLPIIQFEENNFYSILRQARLSGSKPIMRPKLFKANRSQLDEATNLDVYTLIEEAGAIEVGNKAVVLSDPNVKNSDWPTVVFHKNDFLSPIVSFILTRTIPVINNCQTTDF